MWNNSFSHPVKLNAPNNISSSTKKKTCGKQIEFERELSFGDDTDFQTFLLPLEQDFTKSSKGYSSLLTRISDKEIKSVNCKNDSENILSNDFSETDSLRFSSSNKLFHKYSSYSNGHEYTGNHNNSNYQKCALFLYDTLENVECDLTGKSKLLKSHTKEIHSTLQNFENEDHISGKQVSVCTEKCKKIICNNSASFSDADKSDDDSSESSQKDNFYNGCNNSQNFADDSSSDDSIIFSEEILKSNNWWSSAEIKQTFVAAIDSGSSDDSQQEKSKENTSVFFSEDIAFECDSGDFLKNPMSLEKTVYGSIIAFQSEGYVNASFEDDFLTEKSSILKSVNRSWNDSMKNISGEPHESEKVSFVPLPNLVSIFEYEPDDDDYCYSFYVLDQLRFRNRIEEFEHTIAPYLTSEHRANIYQRNYLQD